MPPDLPRRSVNARLGCYVSLESSTQSTLGFERPVAVAAVLAADATLLARWRGGVAGVVESGGKEVASGEEGTQIYAEY